jgi:NAD kinase
MNLVRVSADGQRYEETDAIAVSSNNIVLTEICPATLTNSGTYAAFTSTLTMSYSTSSGAGVVATFQRQP